MKHLLTDISECVCITKYEKNHEQKGSGAKLFFNQKGVRPRLKGAKSINILQII